MEEETKIVEETSAEVAPAEPEAVPEEATVADVL